MRFSDQRKLRKGMRRLENQLWKVIAPRLYKLLKVLNLPDDDPRILRTKTQYDKVLKNLLLMWNIEDQLPHISKI